MAIHDHANNIRTVGMGESVAVLNGVEFRTRHNDFRLNQPSTSSSTYGDFEPIPFPDVPPSVSAQATPDDEIVEMRKYFEAWAKQDTKIRDYVPYFTPILCYLEGAWTDPTTAVFDFESDRHFLDAKSWYDLEEKIRFNAFSGAKDNKENQAYLPTTIVDVDGTSPTLAQWNYRIMCHLLNDDLRLENFRVVNDLAQQMATGELK